jgi:predicted transcriptional regulator
VAKRTSQPFLTDPRRPTRQRVLALKQAGTPPEEIATVLGITTQRVYQHLKALRADGLLKEASA